MDPFTAGVVGLGVYLLAKGSNAPKADTAANPATDVKATLGGTDGASPDQAGRALSAFPAVGDGSPGGSVQTSADPPVTGQAFVPASGSTLTDAFAAPGGTNCGTCAETQKELIAATTSVAPGIVF